MRRQVGQTERTEMLLPAQAKAWATPAAGDGRRPGPETGSTQGRNLKREAEGFSHQGQTETGEDGSKTGRVLNPRFVEMLMGFPAGWTAFERVEMESFRFRLRTRLASLLRG